MHFALTVATILLAAASNAVAEPGPFIRRGEAGFEVVLPPAMSAAIEKRLPGFAFWAIDDYGWGIPESYEFTARQLPWAVVGDFDGDGYEDLVADGHAGERAYRFCAWGGTVEREILVLEESSRSSADTTKLGTVLQYIAPGAHGTNYSDDETFTWTDAFFEYIWEKAGAIYSWDGAKFNVFWAAD